MKSVMKMIGAVLVVWFGLSVLVIGAMSTGMALTSFVFFLGVATLVGGMALTIYLLRRDAHFNLHMPLIYLSGFGGALVVIVSYLSLRAH